MFSNAPDPRSRPTPSQALQWLLDGNARFVAGAEPGRGPRAVAMRGVELDARAHLVLRGWVGPVVLVTLDDPDDPTPAWLVSTRRPEHLAEALRAVAGR